MPNANNIALIEHSFRPVNDVKFISDFSRITLIPREISPDFEYFEGRVYKDQTTEVELIIIVCEGEELWDNDGPYWNMMAIAGLEDYYLKFLDWQNKNPKPNSVITIGQAHYSFQNHKIMNWLQNI